MTTFVALAVVLLVGGIVGAVVKRLFRLAIMFAVVAVLIVGAAIFVIGNMH